MNDESLIDTLRLYPDCPSSDICAHQAFQPVCDCLLLDFTELGTLQKPLKQIEKSRTSICEQPLSGGSS